jgi:hypothetical protein
LPFIARAIRFGDGQARNPLQRRLLILVRRSLLPFGAAAHERRITLRRRAARMNAFRRKARLGLVGHACQNGGHFRRRNRLDRPLGGGRHFRIGIAGEHHQELELLRGPWGDGALGREHAHVAADLAAFEAVE